MDFGYVIVLNAGLVTACRRMEIEHAVNASIARVLGLVRTWAWSIKIWSLVLILYIFLGKLHSALVANNFPDRWVSCFVIISSQSTNSSASIALLMVQVHQLFSFQQTATSLNLFSSFLDNGNEYWTNCWDKMQTVLYFYYLFSWVGQVTWLNGEQ